jgi:hypothetical protein
MFSHNAADNPYWHNPAWYNRDRALFQKYIPLIRRVAEAGWEPITHAIAEGGWVERYGKRTFTVFNPSSTERTIHLRIDLRALRQSAADAKQPKELVHGLALDTELEGSTLHIRLKLAPEQTAVITW